MALKGGEGCRARPDIVNEILIMVYRLEMTGINVGFLWVPAHVGVEGNETADSLAKASLKKTGIHINVPFGRMKCRSVVQGVIKREWQQM